METLLSESKDRVTHSLTFDQTMKCDINHSVRDMIVKSSDPFGENMATHFHCVYTAIFDKVRTLSIDTACDNSIVSTEKA